MWSIDDSKELYGIEKWGKTYLDISEKGEAQLVSPAVPHSLNLFELTESLKSQGFSLPVLCRFPDILNYRKNHLFDCFNKARTELNYQGEFKPVYPIKVNQQRHLIEDILNQEDENSLGLECGSKPELLIILSMVKDPDKIIICNGFKDRDYIETALLAQLMGRNIFIVIDRWTELPIVLEVSKLHGIEPQIGFRAKLNTKASGKWVASSGSKSKFGLSASEMMECYKMLESQNCTQYLKLLHFHLGSQVHKIQAIKSSLKEGVRFFCELASLTPSLQYLDVGGGLGIDYDGSGHSESSTNYSEQEYANDVVYTIQSICNEKNIPHPHIITESGRALVAHSSLLIFDIVGRTDAGGFSKPQSIQAEDHQIIRDLHDILKLLKVSNLNESFNDVLQMQRDVLQLFNYGVLSLKQRAIAEDLAHQVFEKIYVLLDESSEEHQDIRDKIEDRRKETYFCNFSIFQSLPDSWAMDQIFPILPIHRLNEKPTHRAVLVDLTCDSDGKIEHFINPHSSESQSFLPVHSFDPKKPYYMAAFLTGAYQEILGDLHNLFGDTNAVHIRLTENSYKIENTVKGDTISDVLSYVEYDVDKLKQQIVDHCQNAVLEKKLSDVQSKSLISHFQKSLDQLTYLTTNQ